MARWKSASALFFAALIVGMGVGQLTWGDSESAALKAVPKEMTSYREVVKKVLPSVVSIVATPKQAAQTARSESSSPFDDEDFFDRIPIPDPSLRKQLEEFRRRTPTPRGQQFGSGVIIDPKGIVVTNNHVVAGADSVTVILQDDRRFPSKTIAVDPKSDLAIIKLQVNEPLPFTEFGNSDDMEIGDRVLAMGAPFGLTGSVTSGIISSKGRLLHLQDSRMSGMFEDFLQTDAAINPGNSGGPLVSLEGKVIGINTAIRSQSGGFQGVGMAIASNLAREIVPQLIKDGSVKRGYLGINMQEVTPELAEKLDLKNHQGVIVGRVLENSPADKAGLKQGDVITQFDGKPIEEVLKLQRWVATAPIGKAIPLEVVRNGQKQAVNVTLEPQPQDLGTTRELRSASKEADTVPLNNLGIHVQTLTSELADRLGYPVGTKGALITQVKDGSLAQGSLSSGQIIVKADKKPVESAEDLKEILSKASLEKGILLSVRTTEGVEQFVVLKSNLK